MDGMGDSHRGGDRGRRAERELHGTLQPGQPRQHTAELPLEHVPRALAARDTRGFVKLVADASTRKIVGAHILASEAGEMITELALAVQFGLTIENLTSAFHPYLTLSEGIKLAAQTFDKDVSKLSCCAG